MTEAADPYAAGIEAGHAYFHAFATQSDPPAPADPYPVGSAAHALWQHGFETGESDALWYNNYGGQYDED